MSEEDGVIRFICDGCGKDRQVMAVCSKAGDAIYCSKKCRNLDYRHHQAICEHTTNLFQFCCCCNNRVGVNDLRGDTRGRYLCSGCNVGPVCGLTTPQLQELIEQFPKKLVGEVELWQAVNQDMGTTLSFTHLLTYFYRDGCINWSTATLVGSTPDNTKFHKFLMMEAFRDMKRQIPRYPIAIKVVDQETSEILVELQSTVF
jgi:hypothetical protein